MSNPYPSRRELRLQRERQHRAETSSATPDDTLDAEVPSAPQPALQPAVLETSETTPIEPAGPSARAHRRADSAVTSTGMLPIISKPRAEAAQRKPRSRREARELEAQRAAERRAEVQRLQRQQEAETASKPVRRASSPQFSPPPVPVSAVPAASEGTEQPGNDLAFTGLHEPSAAEITDISGLDTIEIRRAELRAETERLTQEIIELGQDNPNVIDPQLLRRQKELADKSRELQDLETAAIQIVEADPKTDSSEAANATEVEDPDAEHSPEDSAVPEQADAVEPAAAQQPVSRRRSRRSSTPAGPFMSGPFSVDEEADEADTTPGPTAPVKPSISDFLDPQASGHGTSEPRQPIDAVTAHGLDTLDAKDVEAPERRIFISAIVMFAIGLIALIIAIILLTS